MKQINNILPLILLMLAVNNLLWAKTAPDKEICITFDELPAASGFLEADREAITYLIIQSLDKHKVKATGFVVGSQIEDAYDILGEWLNKGHSLGNMTFNNQDYNQIGIEQFIEDIKHGGSALEPMLSGFGQKKRYFRYPFLHYGNTIEKKKQAALYIDDQQMIASHATIVIDDYLYNLSLEKMGKVPDSADFDRLMNEYINNVLDEIENAELLSKEILGRNCRQILNIRANRLNAVFLDEMLTQIEKMGYTFISLDTALKDKLFQQPEAYLGTRGVGYLEMIKNSNPDFLPATE